MGTNRKRNGDCRKISDSSSNALSVEEGSGAMGANIFKRQKAKGRSPDKAIRKREQKAQGGPGRADQGIDVFKKSDELALTNRRKGCAYTAKNHPGSLLHTYQRDLQKGAKTAFPGG